MAGPGEPGRARRRLAGLLLAGLVVAATSACTAPVAAPDAAAGRFAEQRIDWQDCEDGMECATVLAPMDWDDPGDGRTIEIPVTRHRATGDRIGSLFMNPGGPGASGYDDVRDGWETLFSARLAERFDLIGWDPRGVGRTTPVVCYTGVAEVEDHLYGVGGPDWRTDPEGWVRHMEEDGRAYAEACAAGTGEALEFIDSDSTIRDLDLLRALVGDETLHYLGFSNGTHLAQRYLDRFPERVGRLVLDGVVDPLIDRFRSEVEQEAGFELAITRFVEQCPERFGADCPFPAGTAEGLAWIRALLLRVDEHPLPASDPADGRTLGGATLKTAITEALYDERHWTELLELLRELAASPPVTDTAFSLADSYHGFTPGEGLATNAADAFVAINCADFGTERDLALLEARSVELARAAPTLALDEPAHVDPACGNWRYPPRLPPEHEIRGRGLPPILVVSTTGDPATPYEWGVRVAERLESGVLVTNHGEGHTVYRASADACIRDVVDDFLIDGAVPREDPHCGR